MVKLVWAIAILLAFVGVALIAYSAWKPIRAWRRRGKACVRCGYPRALGENAPARCPECGREYDAKPPLTSVIRAGTIPLARTALAVGFITPLAILVWPHRASRVLERVFVGFIESSRVDLNMGTYIQEERAYRTPTLLRAAYELRAFRIYLGHELGADRARIVNRKGHAVFRTEGREISIGSPVAPGDTGVRGWKHFGAFDPGLDMDGDQVPDMIVSTRPSAGRGGKYVVLSLSDPPAIIAEITSSPGARFDLRPATSGNTTIITTLDTSWTNSQWAYSHLDRESGPGPQPLITMRLKHGRTEIVASAMRQPAPSPGVLAAKAARVREDLRRSARADGVKYLTMNEYWGTAVELMYSGHEDLGWAFLEDAWPEGVEWKEAFLAEFRQILYSSPHWERVQAAYAAEQW